MEFDAFQIFLVALVAILVAGLIAAIKIVNEYERGVIFRLGRIMGARGPGLFFIIPVVDRMVRVNLQTFTTDIPHQPGVGAGGFQIQNDNGLLLNYPGALGGKTGFTDLARHSFVGAAQRGDRRLVVTLLGAERQPLVGWQQAAELLDWGFSLPADQSVGRLVTPDEIAEVKVSSTLAPTAEPAAGSGQVAGEAPARSSPVNAVTLAIILLAGGLSGLVVLAVVRRRQS
jgi:serine-type D-Ala-D-Ala carboxypeptidase (penicillin-binding protein 5/6)